MLVGMVALIALLAVILIIVFLQRIAFHLKESVLAKLTDARQEQQQMLNEHKSRFDEGQLAALKILQDTLQKGVADTRLNVKEALTDYASQLGQRVDALTQTTDARLKEINQQVEKRLTAGFEKTTETFTDVVKRLALIDAAQQKITELSTNVVSLRDILNDKRSRGAFGEVQLSALIRNVLPEQSFSFQYQLGNDKRVDCMLFLPDPSGNIAIDAKFPLENFQLMMDNSLLELTRAQAVSQFKKDIRKHIQDIAQKYIVPGETADGAMMFIPAEAIFAEIHGHHPDVVEFAQRSKVWMVSPTTLMAVLTTARAVLKDTATRQQLNIIQDHLRLLANDFKRFQTRMDDVAKHVARAHEEVGQVHISAKKLTTRFNQIDQVELHEPAASLLSNVAPTLE